MSNSQVLREYLLALGFRVDKTEQKKFVGGLDNIEKKAQSAGLALASVGTAAVAMVAIFANQMEKLYYASRRTNSTVGELQGLAFAGKQIGLSGDALQSSLEGFSRALRSNPGLKAFLEGIVGPAGNRTNAQLMIDMVKQLKALPDSVGQQYASMFGIDADTYFALTRYTDELEKAMAVRDQMAENAGLDAKAASEAGKEYMQLLNQVIERAGVLKDVLSVAMLPTFRKGAEIVSDILQNTSELIGKWKGFGDFVDKVRWMLGFDKYQSKDEGSAPAKGKGFLNDDAMSTLRSWKRSILNYGRDDPHLNGGMGPAVAEDKQGRLKMLEREYGLPAGLLDAVWKQESGRGKNTYNKKSGAAGDFQFVPKTAKEYGIEGQEYDFDASSEAAAAKFKNLLKWAGGDLVKAIAAYNYGEGNFMNKAQGQLGYSPAETQNYAAGVLKTMQQTNNFVIHGSNAGEIADAVAGRLKPLNGDLVRNSGVVQ